MPAKGETGSRAQRIAARAVARNFTTRMVEGLCKCDECKIGREAARARLAAQGLTPRRWSQEEFARRMALIKAARKRELWTTWDDDVPQRRRRRAPGFES